jgi:hypothetical protein
MAVVVYGAAVLMISAGLTSAVRRHQRIVDAFGKTASRIVIRGPALPDQGFR